MPSLTQSRGPRCISCTVSCLWLRAGRGSPDLPLPDELAAAVSWTCLRETPVRLGCCNWMCPCSVLSFGDPACLTQCACTAKVRYLPSFLLWDFSFPPLPFAFTLYVCACAAHAPSHGSPFPSSLVWAGQLCLVAADRRLSALSHHLPKGKTGAKSLGST